MILKDEELSGTIGLDTGWLSQQNTVNSPGTRAYQSLMIPLESWAIFELVTVFSMPESGLYADALWFLG